MPQPIFIVVTIGLIGRRVVAPLKHTIAVVCAHFVVLCRSEVQLANQSAVVAGLCKALGNKLFMRRKPSIAIAVDVMRCRIAASQKRSARRGADRALRISVRKSRAAVDQRVDRIGADVFVAERPYSVPALLVGSVPQNVWAARFHSGHPLWCHWRACIVGATFDHIVQLTAYMRIRIIIKAVDHLVWILLQVIKFASSAE